LNTSARTKSIKRRSPIFMAPERKCERDHMQAA
jgi:hypothetical protein